jgi:hypothetical protein
MDGALETLGKIAIQSLGSSAAMRDMLLQKSMRFTLIEGKRATIIECSAIAGDGGGAQFLQMEHLWIG